MAAAKSTSSKKRPSYGELETELREIIAWFESDNFDVDEAVTKYRRGREVLRLLEEYLETAENTVRELKAEFDPGTGFGKA